MSVEPIGYLARLPRNTNAWWALFFFFFEVYTSMAMRQMVGTFFWEGSLRLSPEGSLRR